MNIKTLAPGAVVLAFADFTAYVFYQHGFIGFWEQAFATFATAQITIDLVIALSLVMLWMLKDAKSRSINPVPFVILTLGLGSIGPLCYLVRRGYATEAASQSVESSS